MSWPLKTKLLKELSKPGHKGFSIGSREEFPQAPTVTQNRKSNLGWVELSELDVVRHFTRLSQFNYSIDGGFYPLGSCTMKYNPRVNEATASDPAFLHL